MTNLPQLLPDQLFAALTQAKRAIRILIGIGGGIEGREIYWNKRDEWREAVVEGWATVDSPSTEDFLHFIDLSEALYLTLNGDRKRLDDVYNAWTRELQRIHLLRKGFAVAQRQGERFERAGLFNR